MVFRGTITIEWNGQRQPLKMMVLGQPTIGNDGFSIVGHHWSNDGMVTYHRWSLLWIIACSTTTSSDQTKPNQTRTFVAKRDMSRIRAFLVSFLLRFYSDKWDLAQTLLRYLSQKMTGKASAFIPFVPFNSPFVTFFVPFEIWKMMGNSWVF